MLKLKPRVRRVKNFVTFFRANFVISDTGLTPAKKRQKKIWRNLNAIAGRPGRRGVTLTVKAGWVEILPPSEQPVKTPTCRLPAVRVQERQPRSRQQPLDWLLLTTEGEPTAENALPIIEWYEKRRRIEEYFSALKTGTRITDRPWQAADDLRRCVAFDAVTACTVMSLERLARSDPETPAETGVHPDEIELLAVHSAKSKHRGKRGPPTARPTIREFVINATRLAGFRPTNRRPTPGTRKLWEGYTIRSYFVENYRALKNHWCPKSTVAC